MNDWQSLFLQKLAAAKKQWLHRFQKFAADCLEPLFEEFERFASAQGFSVQASPCEPGTRLYKFGLTENGYLLLTFHMRGLHVVAARTEVFVPGQETAKPEDRQRELSDIDELWARQCFESALDSFVVAFGAAGASAAGQTDELLIR
jgi:hypothetical protein